MPVGVSLFTGLSNPGISSHVYHFALVSSLLLLKAKKFLLAFGSSKQGYFTALSLIFIFSCCCTIFVVQDIHGEH
jgi:hypothetical protein